MVCLCACACNAAAQAPDEKLNEYASHIVAQAQQLKGYPVVEKQRGGNLAGFYEWLQEKGLTYMHLNNAGDPFSENFAVSSHPLERDVIEFFAPLYGFEPGKFWGIVTASGTDGNNHGIYFGEKYLENLVPDIKPIAYVSRESHYSNMRLCDLQNIEVRLIDVDDMGRMRPDALRKALDPKRPALIIFSMGSTFMGAIDDQDALNKVIDEVKPIAVYRHVDAALFGGYLPFTKYSDMVNIKKCRYNSIAISGHKFYGINTPCGLMITTDEVVKAQTSFRPEYLNSNMFMINCSRSALNPLKFYWIIKNVGIEGLSRQANELLINTEYLKAELDRIGWPAWKSEMSNTIFFRRPSEEVITKHVLARGYHAKYGDLAHIVVMQHVDREAIDNFIADLLLERR